MPQLYPGSGTKISAPSAEQLRNVRTEKGSEKINNLIPNVANKKRTKI
jgi:hypothetical protein